MHKIKNNISGLTLVEIIVSIAIIGIIVVGFLPLFTMSAKSNERSKSALNSTYAGKDVMEDMYQLSRSTNYEEVKEELIEEGKYLYNSTKEIFEGKKRKNT